MPANTYIKCSKCKITKHYKDFSVDRTRKHLSLFPKRKRLKTGRPQTCQECLSEKRKKDYIYNQNKTYKYLSEHPCVDCGEDNLVYLEFDHLPGQHKYKNISQMQHRRHSWEEILNEINKCEVVCLNCHRLRTYKRQGAYRLEFYEKLTKKRL